MPAFSALSRNVNPNVSNKSNCIMPGVVLPCLCPGVTIDIHAKLSNVNSVVSPVLAIINAFLVLSNDSSLPSVFGLLNVSLSQIYNVHL